MRLDIGSGLFQCSLNTWDQLAPTIYIIFKKKPYYFSSVALLLIHKLLSSNSLSHWSLHSLTHYNFFPLFVSHFLVFSLHFLSPKHKLRERERGILEPNRATVKKIIEKLHLTLHNVFYSFNHIVFYKRKITLDLLRIFKKI